MRAFHMTSGALSQPQRLHCHLCGQPHQPVALRPGQRASCVRCGTLLARRNRLDTDGALACAVAGLILAVPASILPLISAAKWGNERKEFLLTGFLSLWRDGMYLLASAVLLCGVVLPLALLGTLLATIIAERVRAHGAVAGTLRRLAAALERWTMPEVYVLAVLVAFFKLGDSVNVSVRPGLWCYTAMSMATLLAWRSFDDPQKTVSLADADVTPPSPEVAT